MISHACIVQVYVCTCVYCTAGVHNLQVRHEVPQVHSSTLAGATATILRKTSWTSLLLMNKLTSLQLMKRLTSLQLMGQPVYS